MSKRRKRATTDRVNERESESENGKENKNSNEE